MTRKDFKETLDSIFSSAKKLSKKINKIEKVYQKAISIIYEVNPSSNRYIPAAVKRAVLIRDNDSCVKCGATENLHIDHEIALSRGGSNDIDNLQVLCKDCNLRKGVS